MKISDANVIATCRGLIHAGGLTQVRRIADFAALFHLRTGLHGATDPSPVRMDAALNFDIWVPNISMQEHMPYSEETDAVYPHAYRFNQGCFTPGETTGHGVDIGKKLAARYPCKPACLPVNRLEDGNRWH